MLNFPLWKSLLTIIAILLSIFVVGYDFYNKKLVEDYNGGLRLGLDLRGGSYLVLEADEKVFLEDYSTILYENIRSILVEEQVSYFNFTKNTGYVSFSVNNTDKLPVIRQKILAIDAYLDIKTKDNNITVSVSDETKAQQLSNIIQNSIEIVRKRIDQTGTTEPSIKKQGNNQIVVELPGVDDPEHVKRVLGTTARLTFHKVDSGATYYDSALKVGYKYVASQAGEGPDRYAIRIEPEIYGKQLVDAKLEFQDQKPVIFFKFDSEGSKKFAQVTEEQTGNMLGIVMDNKMISAPRINGPITGGSGIITGNFTVLEAQELALLLKAGSLPIPLTIVEERTVGPTLGQESINYGVMSGLIGTLLVFAFMLFFYKNLGLIANISLISNLFFVVAILSILGSTLTLPGIAGIVLTLGMAVDSNILVYERFIQERRNTKNSFALAMANSYKRVFVTILDSNLTTLFTALFLFGFGSGPIRGFAVTLIIGILTTMFSIMFVTRYLIKIFLVRKYTKKGQRA